MTSHELTSKLRPRCEFIQQKSSEIYTLNKRLDWLTAVPERLDAMRRFTCANHSHPRCYRGNSVEPVEDMCIRTYVYSPSVYCWGVGTMWKSWQESPGQKCGGVVYIYGSHQYHRLFLNRHHSSDNYEVQLLLRQTQLFCLSRRWETQTRNLQNTKYRV